MPKDKLKDAVWESRMRLFAAGSYKFSTGQQPGTDIWKKVLQSIKKCPRHGNIATVTLFGGKIKCVCGYHDKPQVSGSSTQSGTTTVSTLPSVSIGSSSSSGVAQSSMSSGLKCSQCGMFVSCDDFTEHLSQHHAKCTCEVCGKTVLGELELTRHKSTVHQPVTISQPRSTPSKPATVSKLPATVSKLPATVSKLPATVSKLPPNVSKLPPTVSKLPPTVSQLGIAPMSQSATVSSKCNTCGQPVPYYDLESHVDLYHKELVCRICRQKVYGELGLTNHVDIVHVHPVTTPVATHPISSIAHSKTVTTSSSSDVSALPAACATPVTISASTISTSASYNISAPAATIAVSTVASLPPAVSVSSSIGSTQDITTKSTDEPIIDWAKFLQQTHRQTIHREDWEWIAKALYKSNGKPKESIQQNWFDPPPPPKVSTQPPNPYCYFRPRLFFWAPRRMWQIPLKCPGSECGHGILNQGGIYSKVRVAIDVNTRYYMMGEYLRCNTCRNPRRAFCPWDAELLDQLSPTQRLKFPAVLTQRLALDKKCATLMRPRTQGNSSSYARDAINELHSEEWGKRVVHYLSDCDLHRKQCQLLGVPVPIYQSPPRYHPVPLAGWFETVHSNEVGQHAMAMKSVITSTYGRILKIDSTKKITAKLAGNIDSTATWMTNVGNERGEVLNSVLTTAEGTGLQGLGQGIVKRYKDASEPPPELIYVDRDCCNESGQLPVLTWFHPWRSHVRLDIWHWMRRFNAGLTTEHHALYGTWCTRLSSCIFMWDPEDIALYTMAKKSEYQSKYGISPTDKQVMATFKTAEMARHCKRTTRGKEQTSRLVGELLNAMWDCQDTMGMHLINRESMPAVWKTQQKHLDCIQDVPGVQLYTKVSTQKKGGKILNVYRCGRGSVSLESFHRHQCSFIPGTRSNATHSQMYLLEGCSRWNMNRAQQAVEIADSSGTSMYDLRLVSNINDMSRSILGQKLLPEHTSYGKPTDEQIAVEYLLSQSGKGDYLPTSPEEEAQDAAPDTPKEEVTDATLSTNVGEPNFTAPEEPLHQIHGSPPTANVESNSPPTSQSDTDTSPTASDRREKDNQCDARGNPGWDAVDNLAAYLAKLNDDATALSDREATEIVDLYNKLSPIDKEQTKYTKKTRTPATGRWRNQRKPSGSAPSKQASERLFMVHGQAASSPSTNRISECLCLRLMREYEKVPNRPTDHTGRHLTLQQAIVHTYSRIQQILQDNNKVTALTNLVLVTINQTTVASWLNQRQKGIVTKTLLQGVHLPEEVGVSHERVPAANELPTDHPSHHHDILQFEEPENQEGDFIPRQRRSSSQPSAADTKKSATPPTSNQYGWPAAPWSGWPSWPYYYQPMPPPPTSQSAWSSAYAPPPPASSSWYSSSPWSSPPPPPPLSQSSPSTSTASWCRGKEWRHRKMEEEDEAARLRGEAPKKRYKKRDVTHYKCGQCGKSKTSETGHTQLDGTWFCPSIGETLADWKQRLYKCPICGEPRKKETGHTRHPKARSTWFCPSLDETKEEWRRRIDDEIVNN